jgi:hypothetical protein
MDRGPAPGHVTGMDRYNALREVEATLSAMDSKRRESMEEYGGTPGRPFCQRRATAPPSPSFPLP